MKPQVKGKGERRRVEVCGRAVQVERTEYGLRAVLGDEVISPEKVQAYQLVVGDKHYKLDDKGNEQAKAYLAKADSTHVTVEGKMDGDTMQVTSIKAADKDGDKKGSDKKDRSSSSVRA
jgi:hypothetical protein